jgi:antitoxin component YwqK of YwqJK toxin-antitoxin module
MFIRGIPMMSKQGFILSAATLLLFGCSSDNNNKNVISERFIHKYGYDVSRDEWEAKRYPGQVLTMMRDGKTIVESYEDGILHGPRTESYAHSQTVETMESYERGKLLKRVTYNIRGVPQKEEVFKSPTNTLVTAWYPNGTPRFKEEYKDGFLITAQYFSPHNEIDSRIENGTGERTLRNQSGDILSKEIFSNYLVTYIETYYPNNTPHTATSYDRGKLHGEKKIYAMSGEPISVEHYFQDKKHGLATYYQNGYKYKEVNFAHGMKDETERHYIDGETLVEETEYHDGVKHGPSTVYCDGSARTSWYFDNEKVGRSKYDELTTREEIIMSKSY